MLKNTLSVFVKNKVIEMLKILAPKVYEQRHNQKSIRWATNSFLYTKNPDIESFKYTNQIDVRS